MADITKTDLDVLSRILTTLLAWSGSEDDTPDDTEILNSPYDINAAVTLGDIKDAFSVLRVLEDSLHGH